MCGLTQRLLLCLCPANQGGWAGGQNSGSSPRAQWVSSQGCFRLGPGRARAVGAAVDLSPRLLGHRHPLRKGRPQLVSRCPDVQTPRSWAWREICWGQKPPWLLCAGLAGRPPLRRSRHPHQAVPLPGTHQEGTSSLGRLPPMPTSCPSCKQPSGTRVSPEQPQGLASPTAPVRLSRGSPGALPHPPRGHPQQLASFSGHTELSSAGRRPSRSGGAVRPPPREPVSGKPLPARPDPPPGRASARGGAPTAASRRRVTGEGAEERGVPPGSPLGAAPSFRALTRELRRPLASPLRAGGRAGPALRRRCGRSREPAPAAAAEVGRPGAGRGGLGPGRRRGLGP